MEANPEYFYEIDQNPEPRKVGTIETNLTFVRPVDMESILTPSCFSRTFPAIEFIEDDDDSSDKQELYYFLIEAGVDELDAVMAILKLIRLAREVISSVVYRPHYSLLMWLTLDMVPSSGGSFFDESLTEEAMRASLVECEKKSWFRPASKLRVKSLSKIRRYKRERESSSLDDQCTICLKKYKTGCGIRALPCGHEFDDKCIMKWFKVNHVCPLCRFELPREDDENFQLTTTVY